MKYVSLDIETTGLNPKTPENILGISMVVEDTSKPDTPLMQLPHFTCFIGHEHISGSPFALHLNAWILKEIDNWLNGKPTKYPCYFPTGPDDKYLAGLNGMYPKGTWLEEAMLFLDKHFGTNRINLAGKNVGCFDLQFLPSMLAERFRSRIIDAGSVLVDWSRDALLDLGTLKKRAGLGDVVSHDMYEDALDVIAVLRTTYGRKS